MPHKGTPQWFAKEAEKRVAKKYSAQHDAASGAGVRTKGDSKQRVGTRREGLRDQLFESKHRGTFHKPARSASVKLDVLEKLCQVAWMENREPVLHLSIYAPDCILCDLESGCVDVIVRLMADDARRET